MRNITQQFNCGFSPYKALLIYKHEEERDDYHYNNEQQKPEIYVESYDIGRDGKPINAHPLTAKEMLGLNAILQSAADSQNGYLKSKGVMPSQVLYVNQQANGFAVWYTPPQEVELFFVGGLKIPSGRYRIPGMLWKANADTLSVYALKGKAKPNEATKLHHAPYLNVYGNGQVCMGTVKINITQTMGLEEFMQTWEQYFFNSYFSHSVFGNSSTKTDTTKLWQSLAKNKQDFPQDELLKNGLTLKQLLV